MLLELKLGPDPAEYADRIYSIQYDQVERK